MDQKGPLRACLLLMLWCLMWLPVGNNNCKTIRKIKLLKLSLLIRTAMSRCIPIVRGYLLKYYQQHSFNFVCLSSQPFGRSRRWEWSRDPGEQSHRSQRAWVGGVYLCMEPNDRPFGFRFWRQHGSYLEYEWQFFFAYTTRSQTLHPKGRHWSAQ